MKTVQKLPDVKGSIEYEDRYSVELARGGSHIASTRSLATLQAAVVEVLADFVTRYEAAESAVFLDLLAVRLEKRELPTAATMVRRIAVVGTEKAFEEVTGAERRNRIPPTKKASAQVPRTKAK